MNQALEDRELSAKRHSTKRSHGKDESDKKDKPKQKIRRTHDRPDKGPNPIQQIDLHDQRDEHSSERRKDRRVKSENATTRSSKSSKGTSRKSKGSVDLKTRREAAEAQGWNSQEHNEKVRERRRRAAKIQAKARTILQPLRTTNHGVGEKVGQAKERSYKTPTPESRRDYGQEAADEHPDNPTDDPLIDGENSDRPGLDHVEETNIPPTTAPPGNNETGGERPAGSTPKAAEPPKSPPASRREQARSVNQTEQRAEKSDDDEISEESDVPDPYKEARREMDSYVSDQSDSTSSSDSDVEDVTTVSSALTGEKAQVVPKKLITKEWDKISVKIAKFPDLSDASIAFQTRQKNLMSLFATIGDVQHPENRTRMLKMVAQGDVQAAQFALHSITKSGMSAKSIDIQTGHLGDIAALYIQRVLAQSAQAAEKDTIAEQWEAACIKFLDAVAAFDPSKQSLCHQAEILGKSLSGFTAEPLYGMLELDTIRKSKTVEKIIELAKLRQKGYKNAQTTSQKMLASLLRSLEEDLSTHNVHGQSIESSELRKKRSWMLQFPVEYLNKKLLNLAQRAREALDIRAQFYSSEHGSTKPTSDTQTDQKKKANSRSSSRDRGRKEDRNQDRDKSVVGGTTNTARSKFEKPPKTFCDACGNEHAYGNTEKCPWIKFDYKHVNKDFLKTKWDRSAAATAANNAGGRKSLPWGENLDGTPFDMKSVKNGGEKTKDKTQSRGNGDIQSLISHIKELTKSSSNLELVIPVTNRKGQTAQTKVRGALIDTGAVDNTYLGRRLANRLVSRYGAIVRPNSTIIYTPDKGAKPFFSQGELDFDVIIFNEILEKFETITLTGLIIDSPLDLIIGLPDIKKYGLLRKCEEQILNYGNNAGNKVEKTDMTRTRVIKPVTHTRLATECSRPPPSPVATATRAKRPAVDNKTSTKGKLPKVDLASPGHDRSQRIEDLAKYKSSFAASMSSWSGSSSGVTSKGQYNCRACCILVKPTEKVGPPNFGLGVRTNPTLSGMWRSQQCTTDDCVIEPDLEGTFLCRHCIVTETSKRKREATLRNHLEESAVVEDNEEYIQSLIAMLHSSEESEEDGATKMDTDDSLCATPANHPWSGRLSLCAAMSTQSSQKKVNIHIEPLPADVLAKPIPMEKLLGPSPELEYDPSAWLNNPDEDPEYATAEEILAAGEWEEATIKGTPQEIAKLRLIAHNRREVFSSKLPYLPAKVTPLSFHVKEDEWQQSSNRLSPRRQSLAKDEAIEQMTRDLVERNVLSTSKATAWSQVHLQKKPAGSKDPWRYCIDFRRLNSSLANTGWPLPKIRDLLTRIGDAKPTHFGKFDLTNGYHQMPLAKESQAQTAFVTPSGLFEWKRVPMGIKQAAGYFQRVMQQVLGDLLYNGVELYIDDIIVYAASFEEYEKLTKAVLERLAKAGIVVSPRKCYLGMSELEILGHTVNAKGVTFSKEKLQGVLDFPLPTTTTKLQSFLGLTTYFRDHVLDMSKLERPLRDMLKAKANKKHISLTWDDSTRKAFKDLQQAVWNCATLFFYDNTLPVFLHTDACDTGIGAYLFQLDRDGKELPIGFMSQALHDAQLRWSTFEQEAFAIHEALKKFQYILRDVQFTLRTDHRNLLYLNDSGASDKVLRWKLDIQQFDFIVEHIPGEQNIVADLYSRLCSLRSSNLPFHNKGWMERNMETQVRNDPPAVHWLARLEARNTVEKKPHTRDVSPMTNAHRDAIAKCHGGLCGHGGVERTLRLMKDRVPASEHWPNMRRDIRQYIHTCPACQFMQPSKMLIATTAPYNMSVHSPMDRINIDTIGPLPEDADGNKYIIVIIDVFSRYAEMYATKDATAITAAKCMVHWIGHYGIPGELLTDNGKQYTADVIEQLCELLQLDHLTIMPYSHQENAIVERANKEVNRILRAIVFDLRVKKDWSLYLPLVGRVMNSMKHSSIGCAPADILFGKSVDLNRGLFPDKARLSQTTGEPLNEYLSKLLSVQGTIIEIAQKTQLATSAEHIQRKLVKGDQPYDLKVDDWVILEIPNTFTSLDNRLDKLSMHYRGPYLVKEIDGSAFLLKNLATNATFTANQAHLHPFNYESEYTDPAVVQRHVEQEFLVEEVLQHRGPRKANKHYLRDKFEVLVQWTGYNEDSNTWEPFESMKDTTKFHEYLVKNKLKYLLTAEAKRKLANPA